MLISGKDVIISTCSLLFLLTFIFPTTLLAQQAKHHYGLEKILNTDGSIKTGVEGSFSTEGYQLEFGEENKPLFKKSAPNKIQSTATWNSLGTGRKGISGYDGSPGQVYALAINSVGDIYIGGLFGFAGDIVANNIVKWDVSAGNWVVLPCGSTNGVSGSVESIAINGTDVYAGGKFVSLYDETQVNYIAKFSEVTNSWSALVDDDGGFCGVNFEVVLAVENGIYDIGFMGNVLYVGGDFLRLGDGTTAARRVAKWDGTDWYPLTAGGINGVGSSSTSSSNFVDALEVNGDKVYIGGSFSTLGDGTTAAKNIAVWDETNDTWSSLTYSGINGINGDVYDIKISGTTVYVGGYFTKLGNGTTNASNIAKWVTGSGWSALTGSSPYGVDNAVTTMFVDGTDLYIGGAFIHLDNGSGTYNYIVKWNGSSWVTVSNGSNSITGVGPSVVYGIEKYSDNLYIGGVYMYMGDLSTPANSFSVWNTSTADWNTFGSGDNGVDNAVRSVVLYGDYVYAGGYFKTINGGAIPAKHVARWNYNTREWSCICSSTTGIDLSGSSSVYAMAIGNNYLYVAGTFNSINGGIAAKNIARYNLLNGTWSALSDGTNTGVNGKIATIVVNGDNVYVGGEFTALSGGASAKYLAKWNETTDTWSVLPNGGSNGASSRVLCSVIKGDLVYFGGNFSNLMCWNSTTNSWNNLTDPDGYYPTLIRAIALNGDDIFISCDTYGASVVKWDNINGWTILNENSNCPDPPIYCLEFCGIDLYAGGGFTSSYSLAAAEGLMKWNSSDSWQTLATAGSTSTGVNHYLYDFAENEIEGKMYIGGYYTTAGGNAAFNIANFSDSGNPMPVELNSFSASILDKEVALHWSTLTEVNNYGFEIERREQETSNWEKVGFVEGAGNSNSIKEYSFNDNNPVFGNIEYRLKQIDIDGTFNYSNTIDINYNITDKYENQFPVEFALSQNYPNPFNPSTIINYSIPVTSAGYTGRTNGVWVTLKIYDILGKEVATLVSEEKQAGSYQVEFNAGNLSTGVYIYKLASGSFTSTKKLLFMR